MLKEAKAIAKSWLLKALDNNDGKAVREACIVLKAMEGDSQDKYREKTKPAYDDYVAGKISLEEYKKKLDEAAAQAKEQETK